MEKEEMSAEQIELWEMYMLGFDNAFDNKRKIEFKSPLLKKAYELGWNHSIIGDDVRSVDYLSYEQIFKLILKP